MVNVEIITNKIKNMIKKIIIGTLVLSSLAFSSIVFAENVNPNITSNQATIIACVAPAVATREAAIQSAFGTFSTSMTSAFTKRSSDLATAWTLTDRMARDTAIKSAHLAFKNSSIEAKKTYNNARKATWQQFSTARKACKAPATGENIGVDAIQ